MVVCVISVLIVSMKLGGKMKNLILAISVLAFSSLSNAGWVIGYDSDENGVLKVSRDARTKTIKLEACDRIKGKCFLLETKSNLSVNVDQFFNHFQTGSAALGNVLPAIVGGVVVLSAAAWGVAGLGATGFALEVAGGSALIYGGTKLVTIPKSLNVLRLYDYSTIYLDSFLEDNTSLVAFPDDSISEIAAELL